MYRYSALRKEGKLRVRKIQRFGCSLCVTLPPEYLRFLRLRKGSYVKIELAESGIFIQPLVPPHDKERAVEAVIRSANGGDNKV